MVDSVISNGLFFCFYLLISNFCFVFVSEGLVGVALTGGIVLGIAGVVGLAFALAKKH